MNEIYLGHWIHTPLHCPFCGAKLDPEQLKAGVAPCNHVLLSFEDGQLQFVSDDSIAYGAHILEVLRDPTKVKPANPENEHIVLEDE